MMELTDDGTLDTVIRCSACGEEFRFSYDSAEDANDYSENEQDRGEDSGYDRFIDECIETADYEHECPKRSSCNLCEALMIHGIFCHETGCSNARKVYNLDTGEWEREISQEDDYE